MLLIGVPTPGTLDLVCKLRAAFGNERVGSNIIIVFAVNCVPTPGTLDLVCKLRAAFGNERFGSNVIIIFESNCADCKHALCNWIQEKKSATIFAS